MNCHNYTSAIKELFNCSIFQLKINICYCRVLSQLQKCNQMSIFNYPLFKILVKNLYVKNWFAFNINYISIKDIKLEILCSESEILCNRISFWSIIKATHDLLNFQTDMLLIIKPEVQWQDCFYHNYALHYRWKYNL